MYLLDVLLFAATNGQQPQGRGNMSTFLIMIMAIAFMFYFIILRPQKREQQTRQRMLQALKKGDKVVTVGGIHGTIVGIDDKKNQLIIEVTKNIKVAFSRTAVSSVVQEEKQ